MKSPVRVFDVKCLVLSVVMGFLFLVSYVIGLFLIDQAGKTPPDVMITVIGWPRWLWILLGGQFSDDNVVSGLTFFALCDTALYAAMIHPVLLALSIVSAKRPALSPPPPPTPAQFHSGPAPSG